MSTGIRTLDDIRDRCWIDVDTGCWHWRGAMSGGNSPALWLPAIGERVGMPTALCVVLTGAKPPKGQVWHIICDTRGCANPKHRNPRGTRSTQMLAVKITRSPVCKIKSAASLRVGSKFSEEAIADIRSSHDILRVLADRHGCSLSYASRVRRKEIRRPLVLPGSSVFALGAL